MRILRAALLFGVLLAAATVLADDHTVLFDRDTDFTAFKTFTIRDGTIESRRPEFNNSVTVKNLTDAVREALIARGLTEAAVGDLIVESRFVAIDYGVSPFGVAQQTGVRPGRGREGPPPASAPIRSDFSIATLVIDLKTRGSSTLVWRGVYNDTERDAIKLIRDVRENITTLAAQYPPKP